MDEWVRETDGHNRRYKREALLNYAMNRWGLNKSSSVDRVSDLIRHCSPAGFSDWEQFYFETARQQKKDGAKITRVYLEELGRKLYVKLSEIVQSELSSITERECIDFVVNLVVNRTFEGYKNEIRTVYGQLEKMVGLTIQPAPDNWDRLFNVDFYIAIGDNSIGIPIKPSSFAKMMEDYRWRTVQESTHQKFKDKFGGSVFIVFSKGDGNKKIICNPDIVDDIKREIERLKKKD